MISSADARQAVELYLNELCAIYKTAYPDLLPLHSTRGLDGKLRWCLRFCNYVFLLPGDYEESEQDALLADSGAIILIAARYPGSLWRQTENAAGVQRPPYTIDEIMAMINATPVPNHGVSTEASAQQLDFIIPDHPVNLKPLETAVQNDLVRLPPKDPGLHIDQAQQPTYTSTLCSFSQGNEQANG